MNWLVLFALLGVTAVMAEYPTELSCVGDRGQPLHCKADPTTSPEGLYVACGVASNGQRLYRFCYDGQRTSLAQCDTDCVLGSNRFCCCTTEGCNHADRILLEED